MASFGMFWWAPITSKWMSMLERLVPGKTGAALIKKILVDQAIFSPLVLSAFFTVYKITMLNGFETMGLRQWVYGDQLNWSIFTLCH